MNALYLDSLEHELELRDKYFMTLNTIISGKEPIDRYAGQDTTKDYSNVRFNSSYEDSLLRVQVEMRNSITSYRERVITHMERARRHVHFFPSGEGHGFSQIQTGTNITGLILSPNRKPS
jgi:hypothetical protein